MRGRRSSSETRKKGLTVSLCENKNNEKRMSSLDKQSKTVYQNQLPEPFYHMHQNQIKYQQTLQQPLNNYSSNIKSNSSCHLSFPCPTVIKSSSQSPLPVVIYRYNKSEWQRLLQSNNQKRYKINQLQEQLSMLSRISGDNHQNQCDFQRKQGHELRQKSQFCSRKRQPFVGCLQSTQIFKKKYQQLHQTPKTTIFNVVQIGKQLPVIDQIKQQHHGKNNETDLNIDHKNTLDDHTNVVVSPQGDIHKNNIAKTITPITQTDFSNELQQKYFIRINSPSQKQLISSNKQNIVQVKQILNSTMIQNKPSSSFSSSLSSFTSLIQSQQQNKTKGVHQARRKPIDVNSLQEIQNRLNYLIDFTKF